MYKVVLIHPSAGLNWSGGAEIIAIELAQRLGAEFQVELLSGARCGSFSRPLRAIPRTVAYGLVRHPLLKPLLSRVGNHPEILIEHLTSFLPCLLHLLRHPPDLIFPHNDYGGLAVANVARKLLGTPILFTEHNSLIANGKCLRRNLKFAPDRLVVYDENTAAYAQEHKPDQVISVIPNGVDLDHFTPVGDGFSFDLPHPLVLCVASLNRNNHKQVQLAIDAMQHLPHASLLICGDGPDRHYYQSLGEQVLGRDRFAIRSFTHAQMPQVYRSADVFTLPSMNEPFGMAYVEAMACGLPVVAPDDSVRRAIVADAGMLCDVTHARSYAAALQTVLQDPTFRRKARANAQRYSWDLIAAQYRNAILETITSVQYKPRPDYSRV